MRRIVLLWTLRREGYRFAQSIVTVVGGGTDDGRQATDASLYYPYSCAVHPSGDLYVAATYGNRIRKVDARTGVLTTVGGNGSLGYAGDGGPATEAILTYPRAVAVDPARNVYFTEPGNYRLRRIDGATGVMTTFAGTGSRGFTGDGGPSTLASLMGGGALALDGRGSLYLADRARVRRISLGSGVITTVAGTGTEDFGGDGGPATQAAFRYITGLTTAPDGSLYVADGYNYRVRRISSGGIVTTVAGNGEFTVSGDGGPATQAALAFPTGLALDESGNLLIAESSASRVRSVTPDGIIRTVAGNLTPGFSGDGGPATQASLRYPYGIVLDSAGNLFITDQDNARVRRVDARTGTIATVAGSRDGGFVGDGKPAVDAGLYFPYDVVTDPQGNLYVTDRSNARIRKVDARTGLISTLAGTGRYTVSGDGGPASLAGVGAPAGLLLRDGQLYFSADLDQVIRKIDLTTGVISRVAGTGVQGYSGDGGPATAARLSAPQQLAFDGEGRLLFGESPTRTDEPGGHRVRRIDPRAGTITTIAGTGQPASTGDGGPATAAGLFSPGGVAVDGNGDTYVSEYLGNRVRRIGFGAGTIATVAGTGALGSSGDGGPATAARLSHPQYLSLDGKGALFWADDIPNTKIRRLDLATGFIGTVAGNGLSGFTGDNGPASTATLGATGLRVDARGDILLADTQANRVRAIRACRDRVEGFDPVSPADGTLSASGVINLAWSKAVSAFRYDLLVDTEFPPRKVLRGDITSETVQVGGLEPGKTYYWQIRAKGDPYCPSVSRDSAVRRFTAASPCAPPSAPALTPAAVDGTTATLGWNAVPGATGYDVHVDGTLVASGVTTTTFTATGLSAGSHRFRVAARASCDAELRASSPEQAFTVSGACGPPTPPQLLAPSDGASDLADSVTLSWAPSPGAATYELFLGAAADGEPPLYAGGLVGSSFAASLGRGRVYRWRVAARAGCDGTKSASSETRGFGTASHCAAPRGVVGLSASKATALLGSHYTLSFRPAEGLGPGGLYRIERAPNADFSTGVEVLTTAATSAVLATSALVDYHHRVTPIAACGTPGERSADVVVKVSAGAPFLTMTSPPKAVAIRQPAAGLPLPRLTVEVRNTGAADFVGFFSTSQTVPFFVVSETAISLRRDEVRLFYLQLTGVPSDQTGAYDGLLSIVSADPGDPTAYPQAPVSLRVTALKSSDAVPTTTPPVFLRAGLRVESVRFAPSPLGALPAPITLDVRNTGGAALDLVADVLPDPWVSIGPAGWNNTPLTPQSSRTITLSLDRVRGDAGGAFPRSTYLTFRTIDGRSSRVLVEDPGPLSSSPLPGRSVLAQGEWSWIVPSVVNAASKSGGRYISKVLITNVGTDPAQAELYYTPDTGDPGTSGYDTGKVLFASLLVPPNDVLALTDPVGQLFGITDNSSGQLEIRSSRIGQLRVQSVVDAPAPNGGSFGFQLPTVKSGDGARLNVPHSVVGILQNATYRTNLILAETSGQSASVTVTLYDKSGKPLGSTQRDLHPYGKQQFPVAELSGSLDVSAGSLEILANPGSAGSVVGVVTTIDGRTGDASSFLAKPVKASTTSTTFTIASVVVTNTFKSRVEIRNDDEKPVAYSLTYRGNTGTLTSQPRTLAPRAMDAWDSVLSEVFGLAPGSFGPLQVSADSPNVTVVSRVYSETASGSYGDTIPGLALDDPSTTGSSNLIVLTDGLEGTADNDKSRGARTNLILTEAAGKPVDLEVSIWEKSQRRIAPAGTLSLHLEAYEQRQINDLFGDDGFAIGHKDRLNVLCTVRPKSPSQARVLALATRIDNLTNDTKNLRLVP